MINTLIQITYDGTNYSGFQIQANAPTIQGKLEFALEVIYKEPIRITGAGRTDAGVHALGQYANFKAPFKIAAEQIPYALNAILPPDIVITEAREVSEEFHARFDARRKVYSYTINRAVFPQVLRRFYSLHLPDPLNLTAIRKASTLFTGTHDFKAYQAAGNSAVDTVRTLYRLDIRDIPEKELLIFEFEGSGFLYRMARLIAGTLLQVGKGFITFSDIEASLVGLNPAAVGPTVPPHGLCLEMVKYDPVNNSRKAEI